MDPPRFQDRFGPVRAAVYIDGFNIYHRIDDGGPARNYMKWLDLYRLSERVISARYGLSLTKVAFFSATPKDPPDVNQRHRTYCTALRSRGVEIVEGHHVVDPDTGKRSEKQTDINLALQVIRDAHDNVYDCAVILSSDSDQAATARMLKDWFPTKWLIGVAPPGNRVPDKLRPFADGHFELAWADLEKCIFDHPLIGRSGKEIPRPVNYNPPKSWVRPI